MSYETAMKRVWEMKAASAENLRGKNPAEIVKYLDESTRDFRMAIERSRKAKLSEVKGTVIPSVPSSK